MPDRFLLQGSTANADGYLPVTAVEWCVGPRLDLRYAAREVRIVAMLQMDGDTLYAVTEGPWVANRDKKWELQPQPSSRDDDFLLRCRFAEWETAYILAQHMAKEILADRFEVAE